MSGDVHAGLSEKGPVAWYWWPCWMFLLVVGIVIFYVLFTPVWIGIRLAAWVSERAPRWRSRR